MRLPSCPLWVILLAMLLCGARADSADEYEIKAGFLYNFAAYTTWPPDTFEDEDDEKDPIVFGILGTDPFDKFLDEIARKYKVSDRQIVIKRWKKLEDLGDCQLLFVGRSMEKHTEALFKAIAKKAVFTVSDLHGFARDGGVARFYVDTGKVKFEINIDAAKRAKLSISSQLLKLAVVIEDPEDP